MKRFSITLAAVAMVALACDQYGPTNPPSSGVNAPLFAGNGNGVVHKVSAGGADLDLADHTDANYSLNAVEHADGSVSGQYTDQFGQQDGGFHAEVNCLSVLGNNAWVSGIIKSGTSGGVDLAGLPVITRVADVGTSANDPPDLVSFSFIGVAIPCTARPNLPLFPMTDGQVKVD
jgi:hypothetical protein